MSERFDQLVLDASCGNAAAADFLRLVVDIAHVWDDLIDRDHGVANETINLAFEGALIHIPLNPFYQRHQAELATLLHNSIRNWHLANSIERGNEEKLFPAAFVLRSAYADIFAHVAYILGGTVLALTIAAEARRQAHAEGFDGYLKNLAAERAARGN